MTSCRKYCVSKWDVDFVAFVDFVETAHIDYVDFCHDSAKQVNLMALAAPSVRPSENKFSWCSLNRSLAKKKAALLSLQAEKWQFWAG